MLLDTFLSTEMGQTLLAQADGAGGVDVEGSDSESEGEPDVIDKFLVQTGQASQRTLKPRAVRRLKSMVQLMGEFKPRVDGIIEGSNITFLELASFGKASLTEYLRMVGLFCGSTPISKELLSSATAMDAKVVDWMNAQFATGQQPWRGEETVAALMALCPAFSKAGALSLPRSLRCLKGWRRFCPARSK
jgi:hypothetical protein